MTTTNQSINGIKTFEDGLTMNSDINAQFNTIQNLSWIETLRQLRWDITRNNPAYTEGYMFYDKTEHSLAYYNDQNGITHNIGQQFLTRVYNNSGSTINIGNVVYQSGSTTIWEFRPTINLAIASNPAVVGKIIGITSSNINNITHGYVTSNGLIKNINTNAFNEGDILYLSETVAGGFQNTLPVNPNYIIPVARVIRKDTTFGSILVNIQQLPKLQQNNIWVGDVNNNPVNSLLTNNNISNSAAIDAVKIASGSVDNTEFGYLNGVTSSIQTQLNNKVSVVTNTINPTLSNDNTQGYIIGSEWVNTVSDVAFKCVDATTSTARWVEFNSQNFTFPEVVTNSNTYLTVVSWIVGQNPVNAWDVIVNSQSGVMDIRIYNLSTATVEAEIIGDTTGGASVIRTLTPGTVPKYYSNPLETLQLQIRKTSGGGNVILSVARQR